MTLSKDERTVFDYAREMLNRGDSWRSVGDYLDKEDIHGEVRENVMSALRDLEKDGVFTSPEPTIALFTVERIMGSLMMLGGILLMIFLWNQGFIAILPIFLIGYGALTLFRIRGGI